jgi:hypothetical protein
MGRNDLVKAVAAVNKNVIVVGECKVLLRRNVKNCPLTACLFSQQPTASVRSSSNPSCPTPMSKQSSGLGESTHLRINDHITNEYQAPRPRIRQRSSRHPLRLNLSRRQTSLHHRQARSRLRHCSRQRHRQLPRRLVHRLQTFRQRRHRASI